MRPLSPAAGERKPIRTRVSDDSVDVTNNKPRRDGVQGISASPGRAIESTVEVRVASHLERVNLDAELAGGILGLTQLVVDVIWIVDDCGPRDDGRRLLEQFHA